MAWEPDLDGTWHLKRIIRTRLHFQYRRLQVSSCGHSKGKPEILHTGGFTPPVFPEHFKSHIWKWHIYVTRIPSTCSLYRYSIWNNHRNINYIILKQWHIKQILCQLGQDINVSNYYGVTLSCTTLYSSLDQCLSHILLRNITIQHFANINWCLLRFNCSYTRLRNGRPRNRVSSRCRRKRVFSSPNSGTEHEAHFPKGNAVVAPSWPFIWIFCRG